MGQTLGLVTEYQQVVDQTVVTHHQCCSVQCRRVDSEAVTEELDNNQYKMEQNTEETSNVKTVSYKKIVSITFISRIECPTDSYLRWDYKLVFKKITIQDHQENILLQYKCWVIYTFHSIQDLSHWDIFDGI